MGLYLTDDEIEQKIERTVDMVFKKQGTQQMLQNQILNLRNRNMQLESNMKILKNEKKDLETKIGCLKSEINSLKYFKQRVPNKTRHEVFKRDNYKCVECGATNEYTMLTIDHIIPRSKGGSNDIDNLQVLCIVCNASKANASWKGGEVKTADKILGAIK